MMKVMKRWIVLACWAAGVLAMGACFCAALVFWAAKDGKRGMGMLKSPMELKGMDLAETGARQRFPGGDCSTAEMAVLGWFRTWFGGSLDEQLFYETGEERAETLTIVEEAGAGLDEGGGWGPKELGFSRVVVEDVEWKSGRKTAQCVLQVRTAEREKEGRERICVGLVKTAEGWRVERVSEETERMR